jgi:hypothetical protein
MDQPQLYETTVLRKPDGRIQAWIRHSMIFMDEMKVRAYTAFVWNYGMDHSLMMDDFGNLFGADVHALLS